MILSHPQAIKALSPGRIVVIDTNKHRNTLGVVLQSGSATAKTRTFTTLVLSEQKVNTQNGPQCETTHSSSDDAKLDSDLPRAVVEDKLFYPEGPSSHELLEVTADNISVITTKTLKVAGDKITEECKKRQIPRFRLVAQVILENVVAHFHFPSESTPRNLLKVHFALVAK